MMAEVRATVPGRTADDTANVLMRWSGGAHGAMWVTNAAAGGVHGLWCRILGATGGLEWQQEQPNELRNRRLDGTEVRSPAACTVSCRRLASVPRGSRSATPRATRRPSPISTRTRPR